MSYSRTKFGAVATPHPAGTEAGLAALRAGGNAVDAAVAAAFTIAVVEPTNVGIGGFAASIVAYISRMKRAIAIEANSTAPGAAREDMFPIEYNQDGRTFTVPGSGHTVGPLACGVPGVPSGLALFLKRYGTMELSEALRPAIRAAEDGFVVNTAQSLGIASVAPMLRARFPYTTKLVLLNGLIPQPGQILRPPNLADTLKRMAGDGVEDFYSGRTADLIARYMKSVGGILSREDLARYEAVEVEPLQTSYRGHRVFTPPLTMGGLTTLQMLEVLEGFPVGDYAAGSGELYHLLIEIMKPSWTRRLSKYGDPRFIRIDQASELADSTIQSLRAEVERGLKNPTPGELVSPEPLDCTSHICAADAENNWVALTESHGGVLGSLVSVPGTGITLGHGVGRFDPRPGLPNSIGPGKKPLNNMAPLIVMKEGGGWMASIGAPGGRTIMNNMLSFVMGLVDREMPPAAILGAPRVHVESMEPAQLEWILDESVFEELRKLGHRVSKVQRIGGPAHVIIGDGGGRFAGATDPRDEGTVGHA